MKKSRIVVFIFYYYDTIYVLYGVKTMKLNNYKEKIICNIKGKSKRIEIIFNPSLLFKK